MKARETIVENYIAAYNEMDVNKMLIDLDEHIVFKNVSNGVVDMELNGLASFKEQAGKAIAFFERRKQTIDAIRHQSGAVEIDITYDAVLAVDFPNGLERGQALQLTGTSFFTFSKDNKITSITDII